MKVLVVGGSGHVGALTLGYLKEKYDLRVFDLKPPADESLEYVAGNLGDLSALGQAMTGVEAVLFMAMGTRQWKTPEALNELISTSFDVSVKGLYMTLRAMHDARIRHVVYASSMSVYRGGWGYDHPDSRFFSHEEMATDALDCYGFTKRLGEEVCRVAALQWGLSINALRLCAPLSPEDYQSKTKPERATFFTSAPDVASAFDCALQFRPSGFEAFFISGDYKQKLMNLSKAKQLLGWEPLARPEETPKETKDAE